MNLWLLFAQDLEPEMLIYHAYCNFDAPFAIYMLQGSAHNNINIGYSSTAISTISHAIKGLHKVNLSCYYL